MLCGTVCAGRRNAHCSKTSATIGRGRRSRARTADVRHETVRQAYQDATAVAGDWFALDSSQQQLCLLRDLGFRLAEVQASTCLPNAREKCTGIRVANRAMSSCSAVTWWIARRGRHLAFPRPKPTRRVGASRAILEQFGVGPDDLDFRRSLRRRPAVRGSLPGSGLAPELRLPLLENEFLDASVNFAAAHWRDLYDRVKAHANTTLLMLPQELRPTLSGVSAHERNNLWMLYSALALGANKVLGVLLWDREPADGPGGTTCMTSSLG